MSKRCIGYNDITKEYIYYNEESGIIDLQKELEKDDETGLTAINDIWWKITKDFRDENETKDKRIADLEAKLTKNKKWLASNEGFLENQKLKQQLAEKDKENNELIFIIEEIEQFAWEQLDNENFDKYKAYDEMLTKIKQLTKNSPYENHQQDKISFAVEQLNQAKGKIQHNISFVDCDDYLDVIEEIDKQIKQLKEMK